MKERRKVRKRRVYPQIAAPEERRPFPLTIRDYLRIFPPRAIVLILPYSGATFFWMPDLDDDAVEIWWPTRETLRFPPLR